MGQIGSEQLLASCDTQCGQSIISDYIPIGYTNYPIWTDSVTVNIALY